VTYLRPVSSVGPRPAGALSLAGTLAWFDRVEQLERDGTRELLSLSDLTAQQRTCLSAPRAPVMGMTLDQPRLFGVVNLAPLSAITGTYCKDAASGIALARGLVAQGAHALELAIDRNTHDLESDRAQEQLLRLQPVLDTLREMRGNVPLIAATRKALVAHTAIRSGVACISDTTAMSHDPDMLPLLASEDVAMVLVHVGGAGRNVAFDVYDRFETLLTLTDELGIPRRRILLDVGLNLGKGVSETMELMRHLGMFHAFGCPMMIATCRKSFIGALSGEMLHHRQSAGAVAVMLDALRNGVHLLRVNDVMSHRQAISVWRALAEG